jgi:hypothetical protein
MMGWWQMKLMKTVDQLIDEIDQESAERAQREAQQDAQSARMLQRLFTDLNRGVVSERFNGPDVKLVGMGPGFVVERYGARLCQVTGSYGRVKVERLTGNPEEFDDCENALRYVLKILAADCEERPRDIRDPFELMKGRYTGVRA